MREDALALYGFLRTEEKQLFEKLITVSGIGPKLAITILSGMATAEMVGAIRANDYARLTKIPGIGNKTAERMCVELRDKLEGFGEAPTPVSVSPIEEDVISALSNLGYQRALGEKAVERAVASPVGKISTPSSALRWAGCPSDAGRATFPLLLKPTFALLL